MRAGNTARLDKARQLAEHALTIREKLDSSSEIWITLSILAAVAAFEGRMDAAREYRRRERATFAGSRWQIDKQFGDLIVAIASAARGDEQMRVAVEAALPQLEANGWHIEDATRWIWAGEREWGALIEELGGQQALLVLRVLEEIEVPSSPQPPSPGAGEGGAEAV